MNLAVPMTNRAGIWHFHRVGVVLYRDWATEVHVISRGLTFDMGGRPRGTKRPLAFRSMEVLGAKFNE